MGWTGAAIIPGSVFFFPEFLLWGDTTLQFLNVAFSERSSDG